MTIYFPNSFEPNGDGLNDIYEPKGTGISTFEMWIFDNNGIQIFHTTGLNNGWNGSVQGGSGTVCPEGNYLYHANVTDVCGYNHTYSGNIILLK